MEGLFYRVPLISVPQSPEQGLNGDRVEELGLGRRLDPDTLTASLLRDTVRDVADDPAVRANLARFSHRMLSGSGARAGADALEAYLSAPTRT
jgi:UDP:flavonoid glycosyltransferase YjiC (YdhE family)